MKRVLICLLALGMTFKSIAHVERIYFLKGKVGEREIAIKMLCYDELPTRYINYFFPDSKKDHYMTGKLKGDFWSFTTVIENDVRATDVLNIAPENNGVWRGTYSDSNGNIFNLVLTPIVANPRSSKFGYLSFVRELDPYESYRLSGINFTKTKTEGLTKDLLCDWHIEKESGISFFRIRRSSSKIKTDSINDVLETINLSLLQKYFSYNADRIDTKIETHLLYATEELISFKVVSTSSYKTSKKSQARDFLTLALKNGAQVTLEDIVWFDTATFKPSTDDLYSIYKYRKNVFAPKVFSMLHQRYPQQMKTDSCNISKVETWALPSWALSPKGIILDLKTPDDCGVSAWATIPYESVKTYLEKKYSLIKNRSTY